MYRKIFTPTETDNMIPFNIPREWYGRDIELIVFPLDSSQTLLREDARKTNEIPDVCLQNIEMCILQPVSLITLKYARYLLDRYDFQLFDSIIIASSIEANCHILYSEDLQHGLMVENRIQIINPFV